MSHGRQDRQLGVGAGKLFVGDDGDARRAEDEGCEAITAAELDGSRRPARDGLVRGDDKEADRAADACAQARDVDGPAVLLDVILGELNLDDDTC